MMVSLFGENWHSAELSDAFEQLIGVQIMYVNAAVLVVASAIMIYICILRYINRSDRYHSPGKALLVYSMFVIFIFPLPGSGLNIAEVIAAKVLF